MILMKNLILILILIFAAVSLNTMASNPVHVIITAGQSNTDGRTPNEDLPAYIKALATDTLTYAEGAYRVSIRPRACFSPSYNKVKSQTKHVWLLTLL